MAMIEEPFAFYQGQSPLLISIPHAGTRLTPAVAAGLTTQAQLLPDTDWHIPLLYHFAHKMGASILIANYSRFVIDLNRPADDKPLYTTATTGLYPDVLFNGQPCFLPDKVPSPSERTSYLTQIWYPYHQQLNSTLSRLKTQFGYALLFDAHSIASVIPRLFDGKLPDLNIGTNNGASCCAALSEQLLLCCQTQSQYSYIFNGRFKGGYITRAYGKPDSNIHAVQLELAQINYMDEQPPFAFNATRSVPLQHILHNLLNTMVKWAEKQYQ